MLPVCVAAGRCTAWQIGGQIAEAAMADAIFRERSVDGAEAVRVNRLLNIILETAVDVLDFDAATVTARYAGDVATVGATDQRLIALDDAQYETGEGPCLTVLEPSEPIALPDAGEVDGRWDNFSRTAEHLGIRSTLSLHLPIEDAPDLQASLNLYSRRQLEFGEPQLRAAAPFAKQLAAAVATVDSYRAMAKLAGDLAEAMRSRAVIEQAKGMLMSDERISADEAFDKLAQLSQNANIKLRDVAQRLVDERTARPAE
jgi:hypothetical protein